MVEVLILMVALAVTGFAGVQFFYLLFVETTKRQQQRRIAELEREVTALRGLLGQQRVCGTATQMVPVEEVWSDLVDDGS